MNGRVKKELEVLQNPSKRGKMLPVQDGFLICPRCKRNRKLLQIRPETSAKELTVFCRMCKNEITIDVDEGECFESHGQ